MFTFWNETDESKRHTPGMCQHWSKYKQLESQHTGHRKRWPLPAGYETNNTHVRAHTRASRSLGKENVFLCRHFFPTPSLWLPPEWLPVITNKRQCLNATPLPPKPVEAEVNKMVLFVYLFSGGFTCRHPSARGFHRHKKEKKRDFFCALITAARSLWWNSTDHKSVCSFSLCRVVKVHRS